jgi:hypothetical protein
MTSLSNSHRQITEDLSKTILTEIDKLLYLETVTHSDAYMKMLSGLMTVAKGDLADLEQRQAELRTKLTEVELSVVSKKQEIEDIEKLWKRTPLGEKETGDIAPLVKEKSFNKAILFVLKSSNEPMSPTEIRDRLREWGYDTSKYKTDLISSIHSVLKRFLATDPPSIEETGEERRKKYRWIGASTNAGDDSSVGN